MHAAATARRTPRFAGARTGTKSSGISRASTTRSSITDGNDAIRRTRTPKMHRTRARLGAPDAERALPREHRPKRAADASNFVHRRKLATETTRRFFFPRRARSFRRAGRHTANVKKWVITLVIGTVTGLLAFAMEHSITVLVRARLTLISRAARAAARLASPPASAAAALARRLRPPRRSRRPPPRWWCSSRPRRPARALPW